MSDPEILNVSVHMVRDDLASFPIYELPRGYHFRVYREGDHVTWTDLHMAGDPYSKITPELFWREYGNDVDALPDRMYFVDTDEGETVGTISAWWDRQRDNPGEAGRIHWVLVHPTHQGRGLSKPMMTHAMRRLAASHPRALLGTSTGRIWALKVYLDFGFYPDPAEMAAKPEVVEGWRAVHARLNHPLLAQHLG